MLLGLKLTYTFHRDEDGRCAAAKVEECEEKRARARARKSEMERREEISWRTLETLSMTPVLRRR